MAPLDPSHDPTILPQDLPVPIDDGAAAHLAGAPVPDVALQCTNGSMVQLRRLPGPTVLFFYPRTGVPGQPPSLGYQGEEWDSIPGARGCTPQSCSFRDRHARFARLGITVLGCSTQTTAFQREFKSRMHMPFEFLSDSDLELTRAAQLPTFQFPVESGGPPTLIQRMAWYIEPEPDGHDATTRISRIWYPVFPPDSCAETVLAWLERRARIEIRASTTGDAAFMREELNRHWGHTTIWSLGRMYHADRIPALVATIDGHPVGLCTYEIAPGSYQAEVITLSVRQEGQGIGARLLEAAAQRARSARCTRIFLTTTNDNTRAIGFYQQQGWRFAALHRGIVDEVRRRLVPTLPYLGQHGIPIRDELEFELWLQADRHAGGTPWSPETTSARPPMDRN